jgi:hypothetical protein
MTDISYDVFISHAFEDKNAFTNALALALKKEGLKVWYSGFELKLGDSIATSVNNALKGAEYAIVVISPIYLQKQWAMSELKALFTQEAERTRILPILHNISVDEIIKHLPMLADRYAISSEKGLEFIVDKVLEVVKGKIQYHRATTPDQNNKKETNSRDSGFITLGGSNNEKEVGDKKRNRKNINVNKNSNQLTVNAGGSSFGTIIITLIVLGLVAFFVMQHFGFFESSPESPANNFNQPVKDKNFRNQLKPN